MEHAEKARIAATAVKAYREAGLTPDLRARIKALRDGLRGASVDLGKATSPAGMRPADVMPDLGRVSEDLDRLADELRAIVSEGFANRDNPPPYR